MFNLTEAELQKMLRDNPALRVNPKYSQPGKRQNQGGNSMKVNTKSKPIVPTEEELAEYKNVGIPSEEEEQLALSRLLDQLKLKWCHYPAETKAKPQYMAKRRRLGVKPGVPDVMIFDIPPAYPDAKGAVIELKRRKGGRLSDEQMEWLVRLSGLGWKTAVCKGTEEAIMRLKQWGYISEDPR